MSKMKDEKNDEKSEKLKKTEEKENEPLSALQRWDVFM